MSTVRTPSDSSQHLADDPAFRTRADQVYAQLKRDVAEFSLVPGDRFTENEISERLDDLVAWLADHQDAAHRALIADAQCRVAAVALGRRAVGEVGLVGLPGMDHEAACRAPGFESLLRRRDDGFEQGDIVAQGFAEAAGLDEVALHVDQDEGGLGDVEFVGERLGF